MEMKPILDRITQRREAMGISETALAKAAGSGDLIRNWRRALENGTKISARIDSLDAIATALEVPLIWLLNGESEARINEGMAEEASQFTPDPNGPDIGTLATSIYSGKARSVALYKVAETWAGLGLSKGDLAVLDLARTPNAGEMAVISVADDAGETTTILRRFLPPYLLTGDAHLDQSPLRSDDPSVNIRYPIVGVMRGLT